MVRLGISLAVSCFSLGLMALPQSAEVRGRVARSLDLTVANLMGRATPRPEPPKLDFEGLEQRILAQSKLRFGYYRIAVDAARAGRRDIVERSMQALEKYPSELTQGNVHIIWVERMAASAVVLSDQALLDRTVAQFDRLVFGKARPRACVSIGKAVAALAAAEGGAPVVSQFIQQRGAEIEAATANNGGKDVVWATFAQWSAFRGRAEASVTALARVRDPRYRLLVVGQLLESAIRDSNSKLIDTYLGMLTREHKGGATRTRQYFESIGRKNGGEGASEFKGKFTEAVAGRLAMALAGLPRLEPYVGLP